VTTHFCHHRIISLIVHTVTLAARILRREFERKIEDVLGEDQLDLEEKKEVEMQLRCSEYYENEHCTWMKNYVLAS